MNPTKLKLSGIVVAMSAAGLIGCAGQDQAATAAATTTDLAHCYNVNACKGHNDCKTAENACAGHATCKGHGFVAMPTKACGDVGGNVQDDWRGTVSTAELVHCYGVNACKGHNDCKTAENACAGHATCKGHGFVATTAKSCADIGGKKGA
jgi:hypothetical protein